MIVYTSKIIFNDLRHINSYCTIIHYISIMTIISSPFKIYWNILLEAFYIFPSRGQPHDCHEYNNKNQEKYYEQLLSSALNNGQQSGCDKRILSNTKKLCSEIQFEMIVPDKTFPITKRSPGRQYCDDGQPTSTGQQNQQKSDNQCSLENQVKGKKNRIATMARKTKLMTWKRSARRLVTIIRRSPTRCGSGAQSRWPPGSVTSPRPIERAPWRCSWRSCLWPAWIERRTCQ